MRTRLLLLMFITVACGDNNRASVPVDAPRTLDAPPDAAFDDGIAAAKTAADGAVTLPITRVTVTYLKPQIGNTTDDPAGFTVQSQPTGPALFVAVDPATTTPPLARGDVVSFTITNMATVRSQRRATTIENVTRHAQGADLAPLAQDLTSKTDVVTALDAYDSELASVTAHVADDFAFGGTGFAKAQITTTGVASASASLTLRVPAALRDELDLVSTCDVGLYQTPVGRNDAEAQLAAYTAGDITLSNCPAPVVANAVATTAVSVRITFSRHIMPGSVLLNGSQFTFDHGLTATAAVVDGRTVTVTTSAQVIGTVYTVTVANTIKDQLGSALGSPNSATFDGFVTPATVTLNEVNANIGSGCDLVELRVTSSGSMKGIQVRERLGVVYTFGALDVLKNDIIVVHFNKASATCNPGGAADEVVIAGQPSVTFARNYDTAYDVYATDTGLTNTDNVITVLDRLGDIRDAVLIDNGDNATALDSELAAAEAADVNQWQIVGGGVPPGGFIDANFTANAVLDSDSAATVNHTGTDSESLRRIDDTDDGDKADWAQGANTWGLLNAGQSPL